MTMFTVVATTPPAADVLFCCATDCSPHQLVHHSRARESVLTPRKSRSSPQILRLAASRRAFAPLRYPGVELNAGQQHYILSRWGHAFVSRMSSAGFSVRDYPAEPSPSRRASDANGRAPKLFGRRALEPQARLAAKLLTSLPSAADRPRPFAICAGRQAGVLSTRLGA